MATQGWQWPVNSRKAHFFVDGDSLCGRWMFWGAQEGHCQEISEQPGEDDCKECWRKAAKRLGVTAQKPGRQWHSVRDSVDRRVTYRRLTDDTTEGYSFGTVSKVSYSGGMWRARGCPNPRQGFAHQGAVVLGVFATMHAAQRAVEAWAAEHHPEAKQ